MASYFTQFSCVLDVGSAANAADASRLRDRYAEQLERDEDKQIGFALGRQDASNDGMLWIYSDGEGDPGHVTEFVILCAEAYDLQGTWGFCWGQGCSRMRLDGFGGGAHLIDLGLRKPIGWIDCEQWLAARLTHEPAEQGSDGETAVACPLP